LHTICTHLRKIEENKKYYLKRKYYLWAWKSRCMDMKRYKMQIVENQIFATHNLEIPGSSPGWSTNKRLILNRIEPLLIFGLRYTSPVFV
jgi:hypothetical protein